MIYGMRVYRQLYLPLLLSLGLHAVLLWQVSHWYRHAAAATEPSSLAVELVGKVSSQQVSSHQAPVPEPLTPTPTPEKSLSHRQQQAAAKPDIVTPVKRTKKPAPASRKSAAISPPLRSSKTPSPDSARPEIENRASQQPAYSPPRYDVDYLHNPPPSYPAFARRWRIQGTVILKVRVDTQGLPQEVQVDHSSGHDILDQSATEAVRGWRFVPARRGMVSVEEWVRVPLAFSLSK